MKWNDIDEVHQESSRSSIMLGHVLLLAGHGHGHVLFKLRASLSFCVCGEKKFLRGQLIKRGQFLKLAPMEKIGPLRKQSLKLKFFITRVVR